jgi:hypothetical protein
MHLFWVESRKNHVGMKGRLDMAPLDGAVVLEVALADVVVLLDGGGGGGLLPGPF